MTEWNNELEKKILKKSKYTLTLRILKILITIIFVYGIYVFSLHSIQDKLDVTNKNHYYSSLVLEWTVPNVIGDFTVYDETTNLLGTKKFSYNIFKRIGKEVKVIGEAKVEKKLFNNFSTISYNTPVSEKLNDFTFSLPEDPRTEEKLTAERISEVWGTLEKLPEGTVGELAFSTTSFMEPEELLEKLSDYDLDVLWMPLYTGEFKNYNPNFWGKSDNLLMVHDLIGLTGGIDHHDGYSLSFRGLALSEENIQGSKNLMLKNMKELLNESDSYLNFLGISNLDKKYKYLTEEGFIVYGAVVTGPTKELLKLKKEKFIQNEQLGDVELWNWE